MFDCHFDLLMYILLYKKQNRIDELKKYCEEVLNKDNIIGGIFNLFYTGPDKMKEEFGKETSKISLTEDLMEAKEAIVKHSIIPENINYLIGIEGLDYLKEIDEIDDLYKLGLRSTNIVWNNQNKFGGGTKSPEEAGLTTLGEALVEKLVKTNIAIDLSHTNEKTFWRNYRKSKRNQKT